jgi:hypothetical protein
MEGYSHTMVVYYRSYTGSRRRIEQGFNSYEEARCEMIKTCEELDELGYNNVWGTVVGEKPQVSQAAEAPQGHTHYRIIAKDIFGTYVSSLLPINEDLQAALDTMDEDLKLIDVYKVTMPFKGAYPNQSANKRLVVRHI